MTSIEFRDAIEKLWGYGSQTSAARHFGVNPRTVRRWVSGETPVPRRIILTITEMIDTMDSLHG